MYKEVPIPKGTIMLLTTERERLGIPHPLTGGILRLRTPSMFQHPPKLDEYGNDGDSE